MIGQKSVAFSTLAGLAIITMVITGCNKADFAASQKFPARTPVNPEQNTPDAPANPQSPNGSITPGQDQSTDNTANNGDQSKDGLNDTGDLTADYRLTCADQQAGAVRKKFSAPANKSVTISGEVCPRAFGKINVIFAVDFSGSMNQNDPRTLLLSCGRLEAAKAIVKRLKQDKGPKDEVRIGVVSFDNAAELIEPLTLLEDFESSLHTFKFCGSNDGYTNYKAAFEQSQVALNGVSGNKLIYFISDGLPTIGGSGAPSNTDADGSHKQAGRTAVQTLRAAIPDLTINSVFLNPGAVGQAAFDYLAELSGGADRVRIASNASDLANKVVELGIPKVELISAQARSAVSTPSGDQKSVQLSSFVKDLNKQSVWTFQTSPVLLFGQAAGPVVNHLVIQAPGTDGQMYKSEMDIEFTLQP